MYYVDKMIMPAKEAEYEHMKVYDDLDEYLKDYAKGCLSAGAKTKNFIRVGYEDWVKTIVDGKIYYSFKHEYKTDEGYLTEDVYNQLLDNCEISYDIHESDLLRTQKHSSTRFTGGCIDEEECIEYMFDDDKSWLPQTILEINESIKEYESKIEDLQYKIEKLEEDKRTLYDIEYLKSKVKKHYRFDYKKYKEKKENESR